MQWLPQDYLRQLQDQCDLCYNCIEAIPWCGGLVIAALIVARDRALQVTNIDALVNPVDRAETLGRKAKDQLRATIMAGRFSPGAKLTIRAVASALDVSLTPAREALYNLAAEGALEMRSNGSVYVHELDEERIQEITKIRTALETLAAREAIPNLSKKDVMLARSLHDKLVKANKRKNYDDVIQLNWEIHFLIYNACRMPSLIKMIESCWLVTGSYLNVIYPKFGEIEDGIKNHAAMIAALQQGSAEGLARAIRQDIEFAAGSLNASLKQQ